MEIVWPNMSQSNIMSQDIDRSMSQRQEVSYMGGESELEENNRNLETGLDEEVWNRNL